VKRPGKPEYGFETLSETLSETLFPAPAALPAPWTSRRRFPDPVARFREALEAAHGEVRAVETLDEALAEVAELLEEIGAEVVVVDSEAPLERLSPGVGRHVERVSAHYADPEAWRALCARADAGITSAEALLAETGSLVVSSGPGRSRLASLLPPVHIAVVPAARMTTDLFTWLESRPGGWPANTVLISGPSKTGDIEQTLSVGVHGPKRLVAILYD
jgi:L-lactate utilization protein LutC